MHGGGGTCEEWELGWDPRTECGAHSPGGTAVYFDLPRQLPHVSYLGAQSRLRLLLCCCAGEADTVGYSPASCPHRPRPPLRAANGDGDKETKDVKEKGLPHFTSSLGLSRVAGACRGLLCPSPDSTHPNCHDNLSWSPQLLPQTSLDPSQFY